jgi:hypothetical protein
MLYGETIAIFTPAILSKPGGFAVFHGKQSGSPTGGVLGGEEHGFPSETQGSARQAGIVAFSMIAPVNAWEEEEAPLG